MANPAKNKGDRAELEAARLLADLTGWPVRRRLGAGRADDTGDLDGIPDTTVGVKAYRDIQRAIRETLDELPAQQANAGTTFAFGLIRRPGGRYIAVMDLDQLATLLREATSPASQLATMKPPLFEDLVDPDITDEEAEAFLKAIRETK